MMEELKATYRIVTPMFLGGASPKDLADTIRPPSIKGALRFWWRALNWGIFRSGGSNDAEALQRMYDEEARIFGGAVDDKKGGQCTFLMRVHHSLLKNTSKGSVHRDFAERKSAAARYLGYGLMTAFTSKNTGEAAGQLHRYCIDEGQEFTVTLRFKNDIEISVQEALVAWGLIGGLGGRFRHGMGSVALTSLQVNGADKWISPDSEDKYAEILKSLFSSSIPFVPSTEPPFTAFWKDSRIDYLFSADNCYEALNVFGEAMLMYRSWGKGGMVLERESEKRFKDDHDWCRVQNWRSENPRFHPLRVIFGLPHNYGKRDDQKVVAKNYERRSSPLFFHVHPVGRKFAGVIIYLPSKFLPDGEMIDVGGTRVPQNITWSVITNFIDGKVGNPSVPSAPARFPQKKALLP